MKQKRDKCPNVHVELTPKGLRAETVYDMERLIAEPNGKIYELVPVSQRSNKQLRLFWKCLHVVVNATGKWATAEHLCQDLKFTLGFRQKVLNMRTGEVSETVDSIALANMAPEVFNRFFTDSMILVEESCDFNPQKYMNEGA